MLVHAGEVLRHQLTGKFVAHPFPDDQLSLGDSLASGIRVVDGEHRIFGPVNDKSRRRNSTQVVEPGRRCSGHQSVSPVRIRTSSVNRSLSFFGHRLHQRGNEGPRLPEADPQGVDH